MTDWLLALVPTYGPWLLGAVVFLSCFALPLPASILLLAAGGFASVGDLAVATVGLAAWIGVVAGDQAVYLTGRFGGAGLANRLSRRAPVFRHARDRLSRRGGPFLFLSRWLLSPIGPYVVFAAGAVRMPWVTFMIWGIAGQLIWLGIYLGIGYGATGSLEAASEAAFDAMMMVAAAVITLGLGWWLFRRKRGKNGIVPNALEDWQLNAPAPEGVERTEP